jgi:hypothetical protein
MAAEAGAILSGMEFAGQYGLCPAMSVAAGLVPATLTVVLSA